MKKIIYILITMFLIVTVSNGQLKIEINNNMQVETTGGVYISGASDVTENGTGYLKGKVESSSLSGATQFAGLTLGTGFTGTITRTTGTAFSTGSPKTALRNYEMSASSATTQDVSVNLVNSGSNDETNGIEEKFVYTENASTWKGYSDNNSTSSLIKAASVDIPSGTSNITVAEGVGLAAKIYLEGPYQSGGTMTDNLGTLPSLSPYSDALRTASTIPANAVDWVLLEIRTGTAASTAVGYRSAFVDVNGMIINDAGATTGVGMPGIGGTNYYIIVKHRNHLGVMSSSAQTLSWITP